MALALHSPRISSLHRLIGAVVLLHLVMVLGLSVAPDLHALVHDHAHSDDHTCAVTLFRDGGIALATAPPLPSGVHLWAHLQLAKAAKLRVMAQRLEDGLRDRGPPVLSLGLA